MLFSQLVLPDGCEGFAEVHDANSLLKSLCQVAQFETTKHVMRAALKEVMPTLSPSSVYSAAPHDESKFAKFYCLRQCTSKRGCQSVGQASSQSDRNTHFGVFVTGRHGSKQWGKQLVSESAVAEW